MKNDNNDKYWFPAALLDSLVLAWQTKVQKLIKISSFLNILICQKKEEEKKKGKRAWQQKNQY